MKRCYSIILAILMLVLLVLGGCSSGIDDETFNEADNIHWNSVNFILQVVYGLLYAFGRV